MSRVRFLPNQFIMNTSDNIMLGMVNQRYAVKTNINEKMYSFKMSSNNILPYIVFHLYHVIYCTTTRAIYKIIIPMISL